VADSAFRQPENQKIYIPVRIIGQPMRARSTVVTYLMNLELLEISVAATRGFTFETIWPFILYVFNNWIKHQVMLMGVKRMLPTLGKSTSLRKEDFEKNLQFLANRQDLLDDIDVLEEDQYKHMMDFSSEIEMDQRFEQAELRIDKSEPEHNRRTLAEVKRDNRKRMFE
jgi:hypothetical protein